MPTLQNGGTSSFLPALVVLVLFGSRRVEKAGRKARNVGTIIAQPTGHVRALDYGQHEISRGPSAPQGS